MLFFADVSWRDVAVHTLVPHIELSAPYFALLVAVLGTTISPYLFFWQSAHRVEELEAEDLNGDEAATSAIDRTTKQAKRKQRRSRFDVFFGIGFSNLVMFSIIVATGATIGANGATDVSSAADVASSLKPVAGSAAIDPVRSRVHRFRHARHPCARRIRVHRHHRSPRPGLGVLPAGPPGAAVLRARRPRHHRRHRGSSLIGIDPMSLLVVVAVINGIAAAPFLIVVMLISSEPVDHGRAPQPATRHHPRLEHGSAHGAVRRRAAGHHGERLRRGHPGTSAPPHYASAISPPSRLESATAGGPVTRKTTNATSSAR